MIRHPRRVFVADCAPQKLKSVDFGPKNCTRMIIFAMCEHEPTALAQSCYTRVQVLRGVPGVDKVVIMSREKNQGNRVHPA